MDATRPSGIPAWPPPTLGEFRILGEIGRGGMGVVFEAEQPSLRRKVALKALPPAMCADRRLVERFRREAESAGRLRHPGIVAVHAVGEQDGTPFFAMERVEGRSLAEVIEERRRGETGGLPPAGDPWRRWCVETIARVADALAHAHAQGVLHRDVKPANILLDRDGAPRLTDFGLAFDAEVSGLTKPGEAFGTPAYVAPEQLARRGRTPDGRADVYALGVTLYQLLSLHLPYEGDTEGEILAALLTGKVRALREVDADSPPDLEEAVGRALRLEPEERWGGAAEFAAALRGTIGAAAPPSLPAGAPPSARRRRGAIVIGVLLALAIGGPYAWWSLRGPSSREAPTSADLARLAGGGLEDGAARLLPWLRPRVGMRKVLSRAAPGNAEMRIAIDTSGAKRRIDPPPLLLFRWDVWRDGEWRPAEEGAAECVRVEGGGFQGIMTKFASVPVADAFGKEFAAASATARFRLRARLRFPGPGEERLPTGSPADVPDPGDASSGGGTYLEWECSRQAWIFDDYPPDYPEVVAGSAVDAEMTRRLTPARAEGVEMTSGGMPGERWLAMMLMFENAGPTVPVACAVDLYLPGDPERLATTSLTWDAVDEPDARNSSWGAGLRFRMPTGQEAKEGARVLALANGTARTIRLVLRPSREAALSGSIFDRYWGGTVDATVPVTYR